MEEIEKLKDELYSRIIDYCGDISFSVPIYEKNENYVHFVEKPFFDKMVFESFRKELIDTKKLLKVIEKKELKE
jgi:hypothetical protein